MKGILFFLISLFIFLCSCTQNSTEHSAIATLPIGEAINISAIKQDTLRIGEYIVIPLETSNSSILSEVIIHGSLDDEIVISDNNTIYFFLENGNLSNKFSRQGRGPNEYLSINDVAINNQKKLIYIHDFSGRKINTYNTDGEFILSTKNDSIASLKFDSNNHFIATYSPSAQWKYQVGIYDSQFKPIGAFIKCKQKVEGANLFTINSIYNFDNSNYVCLSDTLYKVKANSVEPYIAIDKGNLKLPSELENKIDKSGKRDMYIWGDYGYLAGDYYFMSYYYNRNVYYDLWCVSKQKLLTRNVLSDEDEIRGLPMLFGDKAITLWPKAVINNNIFFVIEAEQSQLILPNRNIDDNPIIIKVPVENLELHL